MNPFLKQAYDVGAQQALIDAGVVKAAADIDSTDVGNALLGGPLLAAFNAPEGRGLSRWGHMTGGGLLGGAAGGLGAGALGGLAGGGRGAMLAGLLGAGLGGTYGAAKGSAISREGDSAWQKLTR